jgi:uncharacterized protein (TIRG00374 family)
MGKKTSRVSGWVGLFISLAVIAFIILTLDLREVKNTFSLLRWEILLLAFSVYLSNYILRTWRFRILLELETTNFFQLFGVTSLYGMYLYLLPAKSGEATYPLLLKTRLGIRLTKSTATLIVARILDLATIALLLPIALIPFWEEIHPTIRGGALIFVALFVIGCGLGLWILRRSDRWKAWLDPIESIQGRVKNVFAKLLNNLAVIDQRGQYFRLIAVTAGIWVCVQTNFYLILVSLGYPLTYFEIIVISIIMVPMTLIPLQGFANLGTHEVGWSAAFSLFGYTQNSALAVAVSTHIVMVAFVLALGTIGYLILLWKNKP